MEWTAAVHSIGSTDEMLQQVKRYMHFTSICIPHN